MKDLALPIYSYPYTLTDYEVEALRDATRTNVADGHATQEIPELIAPSPSDIARLWEASLRVPIQEAEDGFVRAFSSLGRIPSMNEIARVKICPTASLSADIVAAVLQTKGCVTQLLEPTFDNLSLLLRRRGAKAVAIREDHLDEALATGNLEWMTNGYTSNAIYIVRPNNPTGQTLNLGALTRLIDECASRNIVLVLDNTFRLYNRDAVDDYRLLIDSGVSFMAFEDTGKVFPTRENKASILTSSSDLAGIISAIYHELYLSTSPFTLLLLTQIINKTSQFGLRGTIWPQVDERRGLVRKALEHTSIRIDPSTLLSTMPVEWLDISATGMSDLALIRAFSRSGLKLLPGRQFYWENQQRCVNHVRLALMRPLPTIRMASDIIATGDWRSR